MPLFYFIFIIPLLIISSVTLDSFVNNPMAKVTRFRPWGVGGIIKKLFSHGHSQPFLTVTHLV
jgi:hypothetical protein